MGLKSKMKIFWSEHRDPILFYIIIVVVLIKGLNRLAGNRLNENEGIEDDFNIEEGYYD